MVVCMALDCESQLKGPSHPAPNYFLSPPPSFNPGPSEALCKQDGRQTLVQVVLARLNFHKLFVSFQQSQLGLFTM